METRKANVDSINVLLRELKSEGELASGHFPRDVSEKIAELNTNWKVRINTIDFLF